jgi:hypothetical protein
MIIKINKTIKTVSTHKTSKTLVFERLIRKTSMIRQASKTSKTSKVASELLDKTYLILLFYSPLINSNQALKKSSLMIMNQ